mgnify:CR=1 FL=1
MWTKKQIFLCGIESHICVLQTAQDLINKGYDRDFGARPLRRAIQRYIEDEIAEKVLRGEIHEGQNIVVDFAGALNSITEVSPKERFSGKHWSTLKTPGRINCCLPPLAVWQVMKLPPAKMTGSLLLLKICTPLSRSIFCTFALCQRPSLE